MVKHGKHKSWDKLQNKFYEELLTCKAIQIF